MSQFFSQTDKRGDMLRAAVSLFSAKNYDAVSVRDIAKEAGVSEAALYKHFKGKEDMAFYIFRTIVEEYSQRLLKVKSKSINAVDKLCQITEVTYDFYQVYPNELRFALLSQYNFWDIMEKNLRPHYILKCIIEDGMMAGEIAKEEVYVWISVYSGLIMQPLTQYAYFSDVLPEFSIFRDKIVKMVRKIFA